MLSFTMTYGLRLLSFFLVHTAHIKDGGLGRDVCLSVPRVVCVPWGWKSTQETPRSNSPRTVLNARVPFVVCGGMERVGCLSHN